MSTSKKFLGTLLSTALTIIVLAEAPSAIDETTTVDVASPFVSDAPLTPRGFVVGYYGGYASEQMRSYTPSDFNRGYHPDNLSAIRAGLARSHAFSSNLYRREPKGTPIYRITLY